MMKNIALILSILILSLVLSAQEKDFEIRTILDNAKEKGGYGSYSAMYSNFEGLNTLETGARLAWVINRRYTLGAAGYGFKSEATLDRFLTDGRYRYVGGYGGFLFEYLISPSKTVHFNVPLLIGAGGIAYSKKIEDSDMENIEELSHTEDNSAFFCLQTGVELEFNLLKYLRLSAGTYYRYTRGVELYYQRTETKICSNTILNNLSYGLTLKIGSF